MKVVLKKRGIKYDGVWEIQDNGHSELVIKNYNHECIRIKEEENEKIEIELELEGENNG